MSTIQIKRRLSGAPGAPPSLANAELAFNEVDGTLYYGQGTTGLGGAAASVIQIGGPGFLTNEGFLKSNQLITLSGDVVGTGSTSLAVTLAPVTGLTPGAFNNVTVNAKGQVTAIRALTATDVSAALGAPPLTASAIGSSIASLVSGKVPPSQLPASVVGGLQYAGVWNASTNQPVLAGGTGLTGQYYVVSTAGTTTLDGTHAWNVGDWVAFDGTRWDKLDGAANPVASVNGAQGAVVISASNLPGAGNLITQSASAISVTGGTLDGVTLGATLPGNATVNNLTVNGAFTMDGGTY